MSNIANKNTRKTYSIDNPHRIKLTLLFTEDEYLNLIQGHIPTEMEDKWFIFHEDGWLYFHRSWTGFGIYKTQILRNESGYFITEFWVERNVEKHTSTDDADDSWEFLMLIARWLLNINTRVYFQEQNTRQNKTILE